MNETPKLDESTSEPATENQMPSIPTEQSAPVASSFIEPSVPAASDTPPETGLSPSFIPPTDQSQQAVSPQISEPVETFPIAQSTEVKNPWFKKKPILVGLLIFVLVGNVSLAAASYYLHGKSKKVSAISSVPQMTVKTTPTSPSTGTTSAPVVTTLHYTSSALNLEFDYPVDWRITSTSGDKDIELQSAPIKFTDYTGKPRTGTIQVSIVAKDTGNNFASITNTSSVIANSLALTYKNPSSVQRRSTNLTFVNSQSADNPQAFDAVLITGNLAYHLGQTLANQNYLSVDPEISAYVSSCPEAQCFYQALGSLSYSSWQSNTDLQKIQSLITSMRITK